MLYNIADQELTVSELRARDYYTGSNSSYNVFSDGTPPS